MAKTPNQAPNQAINQITSEVDKSVEQHTERNLPRIGAIKLNIQRKFTNAMNSIDRFFLRGSSGAYGRKLKRLEKREENANKKYTKLLAHANRTTRSGKPVNSTTLAKRNNDPRLLQAKDNLAISIELTTSHKNARAERVNSVVTKEAERKVLIKENREGLIKQKELALARKASRRIATDLRKDGYTRAEAKDIIERFRNENPDTYRELGEQKLKTIAIEAFSIQNNRNLSTAQGNISGLKRAIRSIDAQLIDKTIQRDKLYQEVLDRLPISATTWDDAVVDAHIQSLKLIDAVSLNQLRDEYNRLDYKITTTLPNERVSLERQLRVSKKAIGAVTTRYASAQAILNTRRREAENRLAEIRDQIE